MHINRYAWMLNRYMERDKQMGLHRPVVDLPINQQLNINHDKSIRNEILVPCI